MSVIQPETIEAPVRVLANGIDVGVSLFFDVDEPWAISLLFHATEPVVWTVGRDLIAAGLRRPSGLGDVTVWPWLGSRAYVAVDLVSPEGHCLVQMPRAELVRFLRHTFALVPRGTEASVVDWDALVEQLLGGGLRG